MVPKTTVRMASFRPGSNYLPTRTGPQFVFCEDRPFGW